MVMDSVLTEWTRFVSGASVEGCVGSLILASWERSKAAGVSHEVFRWRRVSDVELRHRLQASAELLAIATPYLDWVASFLSVIPASPCMISLIDKDGIILYAGGNLFSTRGKNLESGCDLSEPVVGTNAAGTSLVEKEPVIVAGTEHYCAEIHNCFAYGVPIRDDENSVMGVVTLTVVEAFAQPRNLAIVDQMVRTIEGKMAQYRDTESIRLLARMSSFMAHELSNPLTALNGCLTLLARRATDERDTELVERCVSITDQMVELVRELRALSGSRVATVRVHIHDLIESVAKSVPAREGWRLEVASEPGLMVYANPGLLGLAITNLVRNAIEAMPEGGTVGITARKTAFGVRITVWDDGPGIPVSMRSGLFQSSVTTKERGSGLGLLLVRAIVETAHGGRVFFTPNFPRGSRFHIELMGKPGQDER